MRNSIAAVAVLLVLVGCSDPTADKPAAGVGPAEQPAPAAATGVSYRIVDASTIEFVGSTAGSSNAGGFSEFQGEIVVTDGSVESATVSVTIDTTSLWSDDPRLTERLEGEDFFDVEQFPTAGFHSTEILREGELFRIKGNLSLHGVTRSIDFPAGVTIEDGRVAAQAEFVIRRFDFGIVYPGRRRNQLIRDEVLIKLDLIGVPAEIDP